MAEGKRPKVAWSDDLSHDSEADRERERLAQIARELAETPVKPIYEPKELQQMVSYIMRITTLYDLRDEDWNDEAKHGIEEWICEPRDLILCIYFKGDKLKAVNDIPLTPVYDLTYFTRAPDFVFKADTFHDDINFGTFVDSVESNTIQLLEFVYAPYFFAINTWPDMVELVGQLSAAERGVRAREPLRLSRAAGELQRDFRRFSELRDELARCEPRVLALHDAAQLLRQRDAPPHAQDICRRLGELRLRLQSLRKLSGVYALKLGAALARQPAAHSPVAAVAAALAPQLNEEEEEQISTTNLPPLDLNDVVANEEETMSSLQRGLRFVSRVARASLPFQALLLLLLGAAALAPHAHSGCTAPAPGFEPILRYPDGPPPL